MRLRLPLPCTDFRCHPDSSESEYTKTVQIERGRLPFACPRVFAAFLCPCVCHSRTLFEAGLTDANTIKGCTHRSKNPLQGFSTRIPCEDHRPVRQLTRDFRGGRRSLFSSEIQRGVGKAGGYRGILSICRRYSAPGLVCPWLDHRDPLPLLHSPGKTRVCRLNN